MSNQVETLVDVQLTNRNRTTVFWRGVFVVPVGIFLASFYQYMNARWSTPVLVLPAALALIFREVYPSYVLTFNHAVMELSTRVSAYLFLLTDEYPSIERNPNIAVIFPDIEGGKKLNRWLPLVKWFLAIPLYIVGIIYAALSALLAIYAWIATSITGNMPEVAAKTILGTIDFWNRIYGYTVALVTDEYPSFSL
jgi:hypothetical protein